MRKDFDIALNIVLIFAAFTWAWFSGSMMEDSLVYLPKDE